MIITGKTINSEVKGEIIPEPFVKVFVSTVDGLITPKKIGTTSDENGDFTLDISLTHDEFIFTIEFDNFSTESNITTILLL